MDKKRKKGQDFLDEGWTEEELFELVSTKKRNVYNLKSKVPIYPVHDKLETIYDVFFGMARDIRKKHLLPFEGYSNQISYLPLGHSHFETVLESLFLSDHVRYDESYMVQIERRFEPGTDYIGKSAFSEFKSPRDIMVRLCKIMLKFNAMFMNPDLCTAEYLERLFEVIRDKSYWFDENIRTIVNFNSFFNESIKTLKGCLIDIPDEPDEPEAEKVNSQTSASSEADADYENIIKTIKIILIDEQTLRISRGRQSSDHNKSDMKFSARAKAIWPTFRTILENGNIELGIIPKDKEKHKPGKANLNNYSTLYSHLRRISEKLVIFFNIKYQVAIPDKFFFFEPMKDNAGIFKPKFITKESAESADILRDFRRKGINLDALKDGLKNL